jgi:hypothetical protein
VILAAVFALTVATVPVFGGHLRALAHLELRWTWLLYAALGIQVLIIEVLPSSFGAGGALHVASYGLAIVAVFANRRIAGMTLVGLGALANAVVIVANGGVMPASAWALTVAGRDAPTGHFANSVALGHPHLAFLGDVFAIPARWPFANVFSVGDVLLVVGGGIVVHSVCGSRLGRRRTGAREPGTSTPV